MANLGSISQGPIYGACLIEILRGMLCKESANQASKIPGLKEWVPFLIPLDIAAGQKNMEARLWRVEFCCDSLATNKKVMIESSLGPDDES